MAAPDFGSVPWLRTQPAWYDAGGIEKGVAIASNFRQQQESQARIRQQDALLPLKVAEVQTQMQALALDLETKQWEQQDVIRSKQATAAYAAARASITDWTDPIQLGQLDRIIAQSGGSVPQWMVEDTQRRINNALVYGAKVQGMENALTLGQERNRILEEKNALLQYKAENPASSASPGLKAAEEILTVQQELNAAKAAGNTAKAAELEQKITLLKDAFPARGNEEISMGMDDQGRPIFRLTRGGKTTSKDGGPTVATESIAQQKLLKYENATQVLAELDRNLRAQDVGATGVAGEFIVDRGLAQLAPELADKTRIENRTALTIARESLMREISDDPRFSNKDREEIGRALPSTGIFESLPDAQSRIRKVRQILAERGRVYSERLGATPPLWTLSPDEIKGLFKANKITRAEAESALLRFH